MLEWNCEIKLDPAFVRQLEEASRQALKMTADQVYSDLVISQTVPMDTGNLQNHLTMVIADENEVRLVSWGPYARRLYFNPQFNFRQDKNVNAGGRWFDPYFPGYAKGKFIPKVFKMILINILKL